MATELLIALASGLGAASFFAAGYMTRAHTVGPAQWSAEDESSADYDASEWGPPLSEAPKQLEDSPTTRYDALPQDDAGQLVDPTQRPEIDDDPESLEGSEQTQPMASHAAGTLPVLLQRLADESGCECAAVFDAQGLPIATVGSLPGAMTGVWASLVARTIEDAQRFGIFLTDSQVIELRDATLGVVRCKGVRWQHRRLLLTTVGAKQSWSASGERAVLDAIGRQFPMVLAMSH